MHGMGAEIVLELSVPRCDGAVFADHAHLTITSESLDLERTLGRAGFHADSKQVDLPLNSTTATARLVESWTYRPGKMAVCFTCVTPISAGGISYPAGQIRVPSFAIS